MLVSVIVMPLWCRPSDRDHIIPLNRRLAVRLHTLLVSRVIWRCSRQIGGCALVNLGGIRGRPLHQCARDGDSEALH